jgi:hypothetical protein
LTVLFIRWTEPEFGRIVIGVTKLTQCQHEVQCVQTHLFIQHRFIEPCARGDRFDESRETLAFIAWDLRSADQGTVSSTWKSRPCLPPC